MKAAVVVNRRAGSGGAHPAGQGDIRRLQQWFADRGLVPIIRSVEPDEIEPTVRDCLEAVDTVVVAGGDGTVNTVAALLVDTQINLGIIPLGTRNHFAKDLGIPTEAERAVDCVAAGHTAIVDVGEVNGQVFLNNASLGAYPTAVEHRDWHERRGWGRLAATWMAMWALVRRWSIFSVKLQAEGASVALATPFVFVGNNEYRVDLLSPVFRSRVDAGRLCVYATSTRTWLGLLRLFLLGLVGRLNQADDFYAMVAREVVVVPRRIAVRMALDGEVRSLNGPLKFWSRPRSLRVLVPLPKKG